MPRLALQVKTTQTTELDLLPRVKQKVLASLESYADAAVAFKAADKAKRSASALVGEIFADEGETDALIDGIELGGYKAKWVFPTSSSFDATVLKRELLKANVPLEVVDAAIAKATSTKASKSYVKIALKSDEAEPAR